MNLMKWVAIVVLLAAGFSGGCSSPQCSELTADQSTDRDLVAEIIDRLSSDSITKNYHVGVTANNGVITLAGSVKDQSARFRAVSLARGTPGVMDVVDKMYDF